MSQKKEQLLMMVSIVGALAGSAVALRSLHGDGRSIAAAAICFLLLFGGGALGLCKGNLFKSKRTDAIVVLYLALCIRYCLLDHLSGDYLQFLSVWTERMRGMSVREAMITPIGDYNMPYLYLLLIISRLPIYDLYAIKVVSVIADVACALAVAKLISALGKSEKVVFFGFVAALFAPTVWLNSAYWGQCDAVYCAFGLWGLYAAMKHRPKLSMALFALSLAFKLQAVFLLPIILFLLADDEISWVDVPVFIGVFLATMLPALVSGRSFHDTFSIYVDQVHAYPYLSMSASSFWCLFPNEYYGEFSGMAVLLAGTGVLTVFFLVLPKMTGGDRNGLIEVSIILALMIPWLLPKMHERYFYLAEVLSIVYVAAYPRRFPVALIMLLGGFLNYSPYLFGEMPILSFKMVAVIYGAVLVYLFLRCEQRLYNHNNIQNGGNENGT